MVDYLFVPAYYDKEVILPDSILKNFKDKKIALFASVQFIKLDKAIKQLKDNNCEVIKCHGKRTSGDYQLLGCDCYQDSFKGDIEKADIILYIGDGLFHPKALGLSQARDIMLFDPLSNHLKTLTVDDINKQSKKYKANLVQFMSKDNIGILVSTKTGQSYLNNALKLKEHLTKQGKNAYIFIDDTFNYSLMENFPFIEVFVNTACPRIGFDDILHMPKPLININDAFNPSL